MDNANSTGDPHQKPVLRELFCSAELNEKLHSQLICLAAVHILLSITAFLGNTLILVALHKESSLHPPSKLLLRNLASIDLCVGIVSEPLQVIYCMSLLTQHMSVCRFAAATSFITSSILSLVSVLTLTAISVDRLLALLLGLRYKQIVTLRRTCGTVSLFWVASIVAILMFLWNHQIPQWYIRAVVLICLTASIYSYTRIFLRMRHSLTRIQDNIEGQPASASKQLNIVRYRKAVSTALWLQIALIACYLPPVIAWVSTDSKRMSSAAYIAFEFTFTFNYLNSSINPILYCWKIKEVRQAVKDTIKQCFCW